MRKRQQVTKIHSIKNQSQSMAGHKVSRNSIEANMDRVLDCDDQLKSLQKEKLEIS